MVIIVQKNTDEIVVLSLSKNENDAYDLQFKQEFEIPRVSHMNMWLGMNQLYLGIASDAKVFIYVWLGEYFDKIDTLHIGARKLLPFQHKSFMHIIVVGSLTRIFRFSVRSNKFVETQKFHGARDASSFYFKKDHFEEQFLMLANDNATILYKEMYNRFAPFQKVASAKYIHSLTSGNTVILLSVENNTAGIYQYNGWRFLKLHIILSNVQQIRQIRSYGEDRLMLQNQNGDWIFLKPIWAVKKTWQASQNDIYAWCSEIKRKASQRNLTKIVDFKKPVEIAKAHIGQLRVQKNVRYCLHSLFFSNTKYSYLFVLNIDRKKFKFEYYLQINYHNATELNHLTQQYEKIIAKLNLANSTLARAISAPRSNYTVLHGKKMAIKCKTKCHIHHINTNAEIKSTTKSKNLRSIDQVLEFTNLKVKMLNDWKCPIPDFNIDDIFVKESINGISMKDLQERTLKIYGDQEISGDLIREIAFNIFIHYMAYFFQANISSPTCTRQILQFH